LHSFEAKHCGRASIMLQKNNVFAVNLDPLGQEYVCFRLQMFDTNEKEPL
jgi:hypothetical protein